MTRDIRDLVWNTITRVGTCVLVTHDRGSIRTRPMVGVANRVEGMIWFVASRDQHQDLKAIEDAPVCLIYLDLEESAYVTVTGTAHFSTDPGRLKEIWNPTVDGWFENGHEDRKAIAFGVEPEVAECWNSPSADLFVALQMLTSPSGGAPTAIGENHRVLM
ncbi:pyridoxamine 5'-phosphate oxidase family protein [Acuticoccus sp. M5D2P5]|uniref:pyridoxamine 5'-phosphate oxidase family protein n=1 Tax=Acuticoccus kalidii TaxID=2910977 RepID=UPI001F2D9400|nr:pyridoxamine 5'-phosphate oxidase family protein [Acuticoccus kalidii]MCF3933202.1 pyridoxamine 5'-phosphate oxidase family protein [Acuticoccus kalidii]